MRHLRTQFNRDHATNATTLRIEWPSGMVQELTNVAANQILTVTEPARLQVVASGAFRIHSLKGQAFEVQMSTDLKQWSPVGSPRYGGVPVRAAGGRQLTGNNQARPNRLGRCLRSQDATAGT